MWPIFNPTIEVVKFRLRGLLFPLVCNDLNGVQVIFWTNLCTMFITNHLNSLHVYVLQQTTAETKIMGYIEIT